MYSEGKINIKAGDPLWPKNLSLLIFSERKFSVKQFENFSFPNNISHCLFFSRYGSTFFIHCTFCKQALLQCFFRKFNIKGLSCLFIFPPCKICEIFAKNICKSVQFHHLQLTTSSQVKKPMTQQENLSMKLTHSFHTRTLHLL